MAIAIITGASSGIGWTFAEHLDSLGLSEIWVIARREDRLKELSTKLTTATRIFNLDLTNSSDIQLLCNTISIEKPQITYLINNAGFGKVGSFHGTGQTDLMGMQQLQVNTITQLTHTAIPFMASPSNILLVSSLASFVPMPGFAVYSAVKAYITNLGISLNRELKSKGIHVCTICPGPVATEFGQRSNFTLSEKKGETTPNDIVRQALKDCKNKKTLSIYGLTPKIGKLAIHILGGRISSLLVWGFFKKEIKRLNLP